jgi:regulator of RNase E activity RraA
MTGRESRDPDSDGLRRLSVAVVSDVLDSLGLPVQVMRPEIRPLAGALPLAGRAFPIQAVASPVVTDEPYADEIAAVDALVPGSVAVIAAGGDCSAALWGELLAARAVAREAVGVIVDGAVRDLRGLTEMGFPTFARHLSAADARGRLSVVTHDVPVRCGGVLVEPGDVVLGDLDGVVVVPSAVVGEVLASAESKRASELEAQSMLNQGMTVAEVYDRLKVL